MRMVLPRYLLSFITISVITSALARGDQTEEALLNEERDADAIQNDEHIPRNSARHHGVKYQSQGQFVDKFPGGCADLPKAPINGNIQCSKTSGCRARCRPKHQFPNGENRLAIICDHQGKWQISGSEWSSIPDCEPICLPQCQHNGICIAPNECQCSENFSGPQCQYENKPCLNFPPPVHNSRRECSTKTCTISCAKHFVFPDGTSITNLICKDGNWLPTRSDWVSIPDCQPVCSPRCQNGGICLPLNVCQCPQEFSGRQCQYSADDCSPQKLGFNGGYRCDRGLESVSCTLNCPPGIGFTFTPSAEYICMYEKGIFEPHLMPQCNIGPDYQIVPLESSKNSYIKVTNYSWTIEGTSIYQASGREVENDISQYHAEISNTKKSGLKSIKIFNRTDENYQNNVPNALLTESTILKVDVKRPEPKTCFTWGGTHFKTFDGAIYSFKSSCAHTLIQEAQDGIFTITIQNSPDCQRGGICHRLLKIYVQGKEYILQLNDNGVPTFRSAKKILPIPAQLSCGLRVEMSAHFVVVSLDSVGVSLKWDRRLFVQVKVSESLWNRTAGLCGRMNGDPDDDKTGKDHSRPRSIASLASDWKVLEIGDTCDDNANVAHACDSSDSHMHDEAAYFCSELFSDRRFKACSKVIDLAMLRKTCEWDFCACNEVDRRTCACETMSIYVRQCFHDGLTTSVAWRHDDVCPMSCTGGRIYKPCGPKTQATCNADSSVKSPHNSDCEEGCFCPEGTVLHEERCISVEECPCTLRGKLFQPGAAIPRKCNTCTCSSGKWICTEVTCSARCAAVGDPHYVTFDGKHYDFMGKCSYYLLKGDNYSIEAENVGCSGAISENMGLSATTSSDGPSCTKTVTIRLGDVSIKLKQNRQVLVNGEDVTNLPLLVAGAKIRVTSSIFLVVSMPNHLEVWWDGVSRVYVNAPAIFRGQTRGLCGTFTANQRSDFLTPFGDVEQSVVAFANKWKTNEQCEDIPTKEYHHPCDAHPERFNSAKTHCSKIWSEIFSSCHWHVDPQTFYDDCRYDMCSCSTDIERCLCPILADYARECAAAGVKILWRSEVEECQLRCPAGQEYQICGNSCTRSCNDISFNENCVPECVEGCNCPEGQTLDIHGECIPIGQCPCQYNGMEFNAGHREVRAGAKSQDLCTCAGGLWSCNTATKAEIIEYPAAADLKSICSATKNLEVTTCEPAEPRTCRNMHEAISQSPAVCRAGCVCQKGYVLDSPSGACVEENKCPCYHGGRSYREGSVMQEDCNTCKCHGGIWKCSDRICPGVCSTWGDSHFKTFDDKTYDFQGFCDYILVKSSFGNNDCFEVSTQNVPCGSSGVSCSKAITLIVGSGESQEIVTLTRGKSLPAANFKRIAIRKAGLFIFLDVPDLGLVLQWDAGTRVYVKLDPKWKSRTRGLCGDYNDNSEDDFKTPSGGISEASARIFGDSWKKNNYCAEPKEIVDTCVSRPERKVWAVKQCGILKTSLFQPCHSEVDIEPYVQRCIFDTCGCDGGGDCECLCTALATYAQECNRKGIPVKWRSQELCPIQCDEYCSSYSPCMSTCSRETCDDIAIQGSHLCDQDSCIEGCLTKPCPEGQVYSNSTFHECVPKATCKPVCLETEGIIYYEGDKVSSDDCQTCFCSRGKVTCTGAPCTSTKPTVVFMDESQKCIDGWTSWLSTSSPKSGGIKGTKRSQSTSDVEPLPSMIDLLALKDSARCPHDHMIDIRCRTVTGHKKSKETGLDVECSLERGLVCQSQDSSLPCEDFEISVLCHCSETTEELTTTVAPAPECDLNHPYQADSKNCHVFYQCTPTFNGTTLILKTCGPDMMYNPNIQVCDWPYNVLVIRPECGIKDVTPTISNLCKEGQRYDECAIKCSRTCQYYHHILEQKELCLENDCIPGCVDEENVCPPHKYWRDEYTCVEIQDCPCKSSGGNAVKPGDVIKESECERCQCLSNFYTCDKSLCTTAHPTPPTQPSTPIDHHTIIVTSTVSPAKPCVSQQYRSLLEDNTNWNVIFDASSTAGPEFKPEFAGSKLGPQRTKSPSVGGWQPEYVDSEQWLEIILPQIEPIYGMILQGNPKEDKYVTSYRVLFSQDGHTFSYILDFDKQPKIFQGPIDSLVPVKQFFPTPIEAKNIRINPQSWHHGISAKVDILGCEDLSKMVVSTTTVTVTETSARKHTVIYEETAKSPICDDAMGLDDGFIVDEQVVASSTLDNLIPNLRLSSPGIWRPMLDNPSQYVQFDFLDNRNLTGIETKGAENIWTTAYKVYYGEDSRNWNPILDQAGDEKLFLGNFDDKTSKVNYFEKAVRARYLKIQPVKWHEHIGLKAEVHGCFVPYSVKPVTPANVKVFEINCNVCHEMFQSPFENGCNCNDPLWWDGQACVEKQQCPCVVNHVPYAVGTSFETQDCQKCLCAMGGSPECQPKICEPCRNSNMRAVTTELCGCICKPCPEGSRLCPTSNVCIVEAAWCNGVKDCPDDETNCEVKSLQNVNSTSHTVVEITTVETKNVTTIQCEKPVCPPGYKLIPLKKSLPTKAPFHPASKGGIKGAFHSHRPTKGSHHKSAKLHEHLKNQTQSYEVDCPQFSCKPTKPPPLFPGPTQEECPKVECPPTYKAVFEPISIYRPVRCPQYTCKPPPPVEAICNVTGKTFNTFDNMEYKYDICNHILAREMYQNLWFITLAKHCGTRNQPCSQVLRITIDDDLIALYPDMHVEINEYTFTPRQVVHLGDRNEAFKITRMGNIIHLVSNKYGFWVIWNLNSNVKIGVSTKLVHLLDGLCGYFDGHLENDRQKPDGNQATTSKEFGDSWIMDGTAECEEQSCSRDILEEARQICNLIADRSFAVCKNVLDLDKYVSRCLETTCMCINGNMTKEECRCRALDSFATECQAADQNIDLSIWRSIHNCLVHCPAPLIYKDCFRNKCEASCDNLQEVEPCPAMPGVCFSGCFCPDGTVRHGENCVPATECRDCVCTGFGNANFVNFNKKNFVFTGNCTYVLSRDITKPENGAEGEHTYEVLITNIPCDRGICTEAISVLYKGHFLQIEQSVHSEFAMTLDGQPIEILPYKNSWMTLEINKERDVTLLIPAIQLEVTSYRHNFVFMVRLPSHIFAGAMEGLCGNCNANDEDDFKKSNGEPTENINEFGLSWLATGLPQPRILDTTICTTKPNKTCTPPPSTQDPCTILYDTALFGQCHNLVDPTSFVKSCYDTLCEKGNVCSDIEAYARNCRQFGLCPNWRTYDKCPYTCPQHLEYQPCGSSCPDTCDTLNDIEKLKCAQEYVEGCFCPIGHVLHNGTCILENKCFICDDDGHVDGDTWYPDKCTKCSCNKKSVACQTTQCPMLETICQEDFTPVVVPGSEAECCLKYLCIPAPTVAPTCPEPQQPECGYGQVMKLTAGTDGCQKFMCLCMPPEECFTLDGPVSPEVEIERIQPGYVRELNMTGCCPRPVLVCRPETCPPPPACPKFYGVTTKLSDCCPVYTCEPPKDLCLYSMLDSNDLSVEIVAMKIGEHWKDGPCKNCVCEQSDDGLIPSCTTSECPKIDGHPDIDDFVLEERVLIDQCCPQVERVSCKEHGIIYHVGQEWQANPADACVIIKCENDTNRVQKKTIKQECNTACDKGYEYRPSRDLGRQCCGECVAVACVINGSLKRIAETWTSDDFCINYQCLSDNETLRVKEEIIKCDNPDQREEEKYEIERQIIPGHCCPKYTRTGCRSSGKTYRPGSTWKHLTDSCISEKCTFNEDKVKLERTLQMCNTTCELGWEYQQPEDGQCCGRCKQTSCIIGGESFKSGSTWYSEDKCTTFECREHDDQLIVSSSSQVCPDVAECPTKDIYTDGCCEQCNITTLDLRKTCMAEVLQLDTTVGIISEKRGRHGLCRNLEPINGLTECHGSCDSSTYFDPVSWIQKTDCSCCQPSSMQGIFVNLTCEDGKVFMKKVTVPTACSCNGCQGSKPTKSHKPTKG